MKEGTTEHAPQHWRTHSCTNSNIYAQRTSER